MYIHKGDDEEEDRYSAQQRGARPHNQYDKADRSALERTSAGGLRSRIDGRDSSAHIRRRRLGVCCGVGAFALPPNILDVFSRPAQMLCSSVWHGLSGFRQPTMVGSAPVRCPPRTSQGQYPIILLLYEVLLFVPVQYPLLVLCTAVY